MRSTASSFRAFADGKRPQNAPERGFSNDRIDKNFDHRQRGARDPRLLRSGTGAFTGGALPVTSPIDGSPIARVRELKTLDEAAAAIGRAQKAFEAWRRVPAPRRGELVRLLGEELRAGKTELGRLVTLEVGKIESEGLGEVQEMIDICDFAVGLSRQLYGLTIQSERPRSQLIEPWHPPGVVGVISAFNFPVAVWLVERRARAGLRRLGDLEAVGEDAADGARHRSDCAPRDGRIRAEAPDGLVELLICGPRHRRSRWSTIRACRWSRRPALPHGPDRRRAAWRAASPAPSSNSAATTPSIVSPLGRSRPGLARHCLRRDGHGGPALHDAAPA